MHLQQVRKYRAPNVPTRDWVAEHPEVLQLVPHRWRKSPAALTALSALFALNTSCGGDADAAPGASKPAASFVAPLFIHGGGRGAFGCEVVNPPVFLSEAEAREVVLEEVKKAGLKMKSPGPALSGVRMAVPNPKQQPGKARATEPAEESILFDGASNSPSVGFVFVSADDTERWTKPSGSSVDSYDSKSKAEELRAHILKSTPKQAVGLFYEPYEHPSMTSGDWKELHAAAKLQDKEQLRLQVRDFLKWLKAQGVI